MNPRENALKTFRAPPENHNCAQCVAAAFGREDLVSALKDCGGGRAPDGVCGALYAALQIASEEKRAGIAREFAAKNGSEKCRELKQRFRVPCPQCVATAADLLSASE